MSNSEKKVIADDLRKFLKDSLQRGNKDIISYIKFLLGYVKKRGPKTTEELKIAIEVISYLERKRNEHRHY